MFDIILLFQLFTVARDVNDVCKSIQPAKQKWEKIGLGLGIRRERLEEIKTGNRGNPGKCMFATMDVWLRGSSKKGLKQPTWRILIRTLQSREVAESTLAERLMTEKGKDV